MGRKALLTRYHPNYGQMSVTPAGYNGPNRFSYSLFKHAITGGVKPLIEHNPHKCLLKFQVTATGGFSDGLMYGASTLPRSLKPFAALTRSGHCFFNI